MQIAVSRERRNDSKQRLSKRVFTLVTMKIFIQNFNFY